MKIVDKMPMKREIEKPRVRFCYECGRKLRGNSYIKEIIGSTFNSDNTGVEKREEDGK